MAGAAYAPEVATCFEADGPGSGSNKLCQEGVWGMGPRVVA